MYGQYDYEVNKKRIWNLEIKFTKYTKYNKIYKGNLKNVGGESHRSAFSIFKKICACFDGSVSADQFLTSRRFRRHTSVAK